MRTRTFFLLLAIVAVVPPCCPAPSPDGDRLSAEARRWLYRNPEHAARLASEAAARYDGRPGEPARLQALLLYANAEQLLGNFDAAIKCLYDIRRAAGSGGADARLRADVSSMMGRIYGKLGSYDKAIRLNEEATAAFKALADSGAVARCYNERGVIHHFMEEFDVAERFFRMSLDISRSLGDEKGVATTLNNLCLYEGNTAEKLGFIEEAIAINTRLGNRWSIGENYNNKGKQLYYAARYADALAALDVARRTAEAIGARELTSDNLEYASMVHAALGHWRQAFEALRGMHALQRELQGADKLRNIEEDVARSERQRLSYEAQEELHREKMGRLTAMAWLMGVLLVAAVVVGVLLWLHLRRRRQLEQAAERHRRQERELADVRGELVSSRQESTNYAVYIRARNELLGRIRSMVREGYRMEPGGELLVQLKRISAYIGQVLKEQAASRALPSGVEEHSREFVERLLRLHPGLTRGERHLATLVRVGLSTQEIATISGIAPKTVNMGRYRLRKSLGLAPGADLTEYLRGI